MTREWWEDAFDEPMGRVLFRTGIVQAAEEQVRFLLEATGADPSWRVLDLCCGNGRCLRPLARFGVRAVGLDLSRAYLEQAKEAGDEQGASAALIRGNMRALPFGERFDLVISMFTSFGYFDDPGDNQRVLDEIARVLRPGGLFLIDLVNRDWVIRNFQPRGWTELDEGYLLEERRFDPERNMMVNRWISSLPDAVREVHLTHYMYSAHELSGMLGQAGLELSKLFGGLDGRPFVFDSHRLVALARKPGG